MFTSLYKMTIPATIGKVDVSIETDVINTNIPLFLSKASMKSANTEINFKDDTVRMLGQKQEVIVTSSGHYAITLNNKVDILKDVTTKGASITLNVSKYENDKRKMALKLHCQFSHPRSNKLIELVNRAGRGSDRELIENIKNVSRMCQICKEYHRQRARPAVGVNGLTV